MGKKAVAVSDVYYELYRGHTLLVSLAGKQAYSDEEYQAIMDDVAHLVRRKINILLVSNEQLEEMACSLIDRFGSQINEIILINHDGGVRDKRGWIAPLLTGSSIEKILAGQHPDFRAVTKDLRGQLTQVLSLLPKVGKISLISPTGLKGEIVRWRGSGTMCVDSKQLNLSPLQDSEMPIFREVYEAYVAENKFRRRSERELQSVGRCHQILRAKNSPIAGFSLVEHTAPWLELSVWWAQYKGDGFGTRVLDAAKQQAAARGRRLFALSTEDDAIEILTRCGFRNLGRISAITARQPYPPDLQDLPDLPNSVRNYDNSTRDPFILVEGSPARPNGGDVETATRVS
ncbi:MAG: hypothetical protein RIS70_2865 [Planctomycetota bacterium]|jgi:GNAT superfamily N-acetyltransferase